MNQLTTDKRAQIVACLVEGNSIRATCRMTGAAKNTVVRLLVELGGACECFHDLTMNGLTCKRVQVDEIWSFVYAKNRNVPDTKLLPMDSGGRHRGAGDVWTWTAIDADNKLAVSWLIGGRDAGYARTFMHDIASRLANRVQLTSDGLAAYLLAVPEAFGDDVDFATLQKIYGPDGVERSPERKYSPGKINGSKRVAVIGEPDVGHVSTSFVERNNLTMRMGMRRFTRLTNGFSKKLRNLECAVALHFTHYNFCRKHMTLKTTPAVAVGVADHVWSLEELVGLLKESN